MYLGKPYSQGLSQVLLGIAVMNGQVSVSVVVYEGNEQVQKLINW